MSTYALTDETAIDVLIFWIESTDGSISFKEQAAVKRVLSNMKYDLSTYHQTMSHIGAMSTSHVAEIVEEAITYVKSNFSDEGKKITYHLLDTIAHCDGKASSADLEKLDKLKSEFGV